MTNDKAAEVGEETATAEEWCDLVLLREGLIIHNYHGWGAGHYEWPAEQEKEFRTKKITRAEFNEKAARCSQSSDRSFIVPENLI